MEKLVKFSGLVAPLPRANIDTDQIIPKQFLKRVERSGFGEFLFYNWRIRPDGSPDPGFVLNQPRYQGARILVAGENFGCGSSREHAPWALLDYGFRVLIAPSFADIFKANCFQNGILPIALEPQLCGEWLKRAEANEGYRLTVDLPAQTLTGSDGYACSFGVDPFRKRCLIEGLDDIALTLQNEAAIKDYERSHAATWQAAIAQGE